MFTCQPIQVSEHVNAKWPGNKGTTFSPLSCHLFIPSLFPLFLRVFPFSQPLSLTFIYLFLCLHHPFFFSLTLLLSSLFHFYSLSIRSFFFFPFISLFHCVFPSSTSLSLPFIPPPRTLPFHFPLVSPSSTSFSLPFNPFVLTLPFHFLRVSSSSTFLSLPFIPLALTLPFHFFLRVPPASCQPPPPRDPGLPSPPYKPRMMEWEHNKRQQEPYPHPARGKAPSIDVIPPSSEGDGAGGGGGGCRKSYVVGRLFGLGSVSLSLLSSLVRFLVVVLSSSSFVCIVWDLVLFFCLLYSRFVPCFQRLLYPSFPLSLHCLICHTLSFFFYQPITPCLILPRLQTSSPSSLHLTLSPFA